VTAKRPSYLGLLVLVPIQWLVPRALAGAGSGGRLGGVRCTVDHTDTRDTETHMRPVMCVLPIVGALLTNVNYALTAAIRTRCTRSA